MSTELSDAIVIAESIERGASREQIVARRLTARNATLLSIRGRVLAEPTQTGLCNDILSMIGIKDGPETVSGPLWEILYIMRDALNGKPNTTYYHGLHDAYFKLKAYLGIPKEQDCPPIKPAAAPDARCEHTLNTTCQRCAPYGLCHQCKTGIATNPMGIPGTALLCDDCTKAFIIQWTKDNEQPSPAAPDALEQAAAALFVHALRKIWLADLIPGKAGTLFDIILAAISTRKE